MLTVLLAVLADIYPGTQPDSDLRSKAEASVALYCLANFFANFEPNVTIFIIPGKIFPDALPLDRTWNRQKLIAIVSQVILFRVGKSDKKLKGMLGKFAGVAFTGIGSTWLLDETKDRSLEHLSRENQRMFTRGVTEVELWRSPSAWSSSALS
ncbi:hypothetical protein BJV77DRAFT_1069522 [Russula vinacea]|nr:hypothetical protein BJV77DRAFT_1069522 [Russula vinacea]